MTQNEKKRKIKPSTVILGSALGLSLLAGKHEHNRLEKLLTDQHNSEWKLREANAVDQVDLVNLAQSAINLQLDIQDGKRLTPQEQLRAIFTLASLHGMHRQAAAINDHATSGTAFLCHRQLKTVLEKQGYLNSLKAGLPARTRKRLGLE